MRARQQQQQQQSQGAGEDNDVNDLIAQLEAANGLPSGRGTSGQSSARRQVTSGGGEGGGELSGKKKRGGKHAKEDDGEGAGMTEEEVEKMKAIRKKFKEQHKQMLLSLMLKNKEQELQVND